MRILITGGCGFVGAFTALGLGIEVDEGWMKVRTVEL